MSSIICGLSAWEVYPVVQLSWGCCNFILELKIGVDNRKFSLSQRRTENEGGAAERSSLCRTPARLAFANPVDGVLSKIIAKLESHQIPRSLAITQWDYISLLKGLGGKTGCRSASINNRVKAN
jgi:hypothetical protein